MLAPLLRNGRVLPQVRFSVGDWRLDSAGVLARISAAPWGEGRSSCAAALGARMATWLPRLEIHSVLGVAGSEAVTAAIGRVIDSFGDGQTEGDQIFVQPMLDRVAMAGVAFSRNPSGGPYFVINYDDRSGLTNRVTAGVGEDLKTFYCLKSRTDAAPASLAPVVALLVELETLLDCDAVDVEFAVGGDGALYLLQVRPLAVDRHDEVPDAKVDDAVADIARKVELISRPSLSARQPHGLRRHAGLEPGRNDRDPAGPSPCRCTGNSLPMRSGHISAITTATGIFAVFRSWLAFTDCPTSTCA